MRYTKATIVLALIGLVSVAQTSCSNIAYKIAYQTADRLIFGRIDALFDLRDDQETFVKERLRAHIAWHRAKELPRYATGLSALRAKGNDGLSRADVDWLFVEFEGAWQRIVDHVLMDTAVFLATVDEKQVRRYEEKTAADNQEMVKFLAMPPEKQLIERQRKYVANTKDWAGSLTSEQEEAIRRLVPGVPDTTQARLVFRRSRQAELAALLRSKAGAPRIEQSLRVWYGSGDAGMTPEYRVQSLLWREKMKEFVIAVDKLLTPEQRNHAGRRAEELAGVARELYANVAQQ